MSIPDHRRFVPRSDVESILLDDPLDPEFIDDVDAALGSTIDELQQPSS